MSINSKQAVIIFVVSILASTINAQIPTCALRDGQNQPVSTQVSYNGML